MNSDCRPKPNNGRARAVFLDRDGVINRPMVREGKPYPPQSLDQFEIYPEVVEACSAMKQANFVLVVVTNQPDVGRGTQDQVVVEAMHARMCAKLPIDRVEVCYDPGPGESSPDYKPAPGLVYRAARELNVELCSSFMVGDRWRDIDCGTSAGCRTILIDRGYREALRCLPDFTAANLMEAARIILGDSDAEYKA